MQNFKDIEEKIIKTKSGYKIKDSTELATKILMLLEIIFHMSYFISIL